jgi:Family of unknown function (DUF6221)
MREIGNSSVTDTLAEFLTARLDEDAKVADALYFAARIPDKVPDFFAAGGPAAEQFWGRFDPAWVLREVEAKRAILAEHTSVPSRYIESSTCALCSVHTMKASTPVRWPCETVCALAAVYSGHPDYRAEWKA